VHPLEEGGRESHPSANADCPLRIPMRLSSPATRWSLTNPRERAPWFGNPQRHRKLVGPEKFMARTIMVPRQRTIGPSTVQPRV
jgi:hypothetical protein